MNTGALTVLMAAMQFDATNAVVANVIRNHDSMINTHANDNDVRQKYRI